MKGVNEVVATVGVWVPLRASGESVFQGQGKRVLREFTGGVDGVGSVGDERGILEMWEVLEVHIQSSLGGVCLLWCEHVGCV